MMTSGGLQPPYLMANGPGYAPTMGGHQSSSPTFTAYSSPPMSSDSPYILPTLPPTDGPYNYGNNNATRQSQPGDLVCSDRDGPYPNVGVSQPGESSSYGLMTSCGAPVYISPTGGSYQSGLASQDDKGMLGRPMATQVQPPPGLARDKRSSESEASYEDLAGRPWTGKTECEDGEEGSESEEEEGDEHLQQQTKRRKVHHDLISGAPVQPLQASPEQTVPGNTEPQGVSPTVTGGSLYGMGSHHEHMCGTYGAYTQAGVYGAYPSAPSQVDPVHPHFMDQGEPLTTGAAYN